MDVKPPPPLIVLPKQELAALMPFGEYGRKPGRTEAHEITLFDGSGVGIRDVAASARAYELAKWRGAGSRLSLV